MQITATITTHTTDTCPVTYLTIHRMTVTTTDGDTLPIRGTQGILAEHGGPRVGLDIVADVRPKPAPKDGHHGINAIEIA